MPNLQELQTHIIAMALCSRIRLTERFPVAERAEALSVSSDSASVQELSVKELSDDSEKIRLIVVK